MAIEREDSAKIERERTKEEREAARELETPEAAAARLRERAELTVSEIKTAATQAQNIVVHAGQVLAAIQKLRQLLQIAAPDDGETPPSVVKDKERVRQLKAEILALQNDLSQMSGDIFPAYLLLMKKENPNISDKDVFLKLQELYTEAGLDFAALNPNLSV